MADRSANPRDSVSTPPAPSPAPLPRRTPGATLQQPRPSRPTAVYGAPSLGAHLDRITFPIHADRAFGEAPTGGAA